ncbi:MAG: hypothetical protein DLM52_06060 [Chthoniobacterales bacterium]|nr:MAG: hypothetical protein DLM52_06060 [Chthoniobacterales bacterium]
MIPFMPDVHSALKQLRERELQIFANLGAGHITMREARREMASCGRATEEIRKKIRRQKRALARL